MADISENILKYTVTGLADVERIAAATYKLARAHEDLNRQMYGTKAAGAKVTEGLITYNSAGQKVTQTTTMMNGKILETSRIVDQTNRSVGSGTRSVYAYGASWRFVSRLIVASLISRTLGLLIRSIRDGISEVSEFQIRISEIRTISQDASLTFNEWADSVRNLSDAFGSPLLETAEGYYQAISNQIAKGAEVTEFMTEAQRLSLITVSSLDEAVLGLTGALNAYGKGVEYARDYSDQFFKTVELGRLRLGQIGNTYGRINILGAELGVSFAETNAAMTALTIKGLQVTEAMTFIRNVLLKLIRPTDAMRELFAEWGVESGEAAIRTWGFSGVLQKLAEHAAATADPLDEIGELFGRIRAIVGAAGLVKAFDKYSTNLDKIKNGAEQANKALEEMIKSAGFKLKRELERVKNFFVVDIGQKAVEAIVELTDVFGGLVKVVETLTIVAGSAAAVLGAIALVLHPYLALSIAVGALIAGLYQLAKAAGIVVKNVNLMDEVTTDAYKIQLERRIIETRKALTKITDVTIENIDKQVKQYAQMFAFLRARYNELKELHDVQKDIQKELLEQKKLTEKPETYMADVIAAINQAKTEYQNLITVGKGEILSSERLTEAKDKLVEIRELIREIESIKGPIDFGPKFFPLRKGEKVPNYLKMLGGDFVRDITSAKDLAFKLQKELTAEFVKFDKLARSNKDVSKDTFKNREKEFEKTQQEVVEAGKLFETTVDYRQELVEINRKYQELTSGMKVASEALSEIQTNWVTKAFGDSRGIDLFEERVKQIQQIVANIGEEWDAKDIKLYYDAAGRLETAALKAAAPAGLVEQLHSLSINARSAHELYVKMNQLKGVLDGLDTKLPDLAGTLEGINGDFAALEDAWKAQGEAGIGELNVLEIKLQELSNNLKQFNEQLRISIQMLPPLEAATKAITEAATEATGGYIKRFAEGGSVASDSIIARLAPGEFVFDKIATRQFLPQITAMNSRAARFDTGGNITNNIGDINVTVQGGDTSELTVRRIGAALRREIKRGNVRLN